MSKKNPSPWKGCVMLTAKLLYQITREVQDFCTSKSFIKHAFLIQTKNEDLSLESYLGTYGS